MSSFANALVAPVLKHQEAMHGRLTNRTFIEKKDFTILAWPITLIVAPIIVASMGFGICLANKIA
jgi:hypothetical protein